MRTWLPLTVFVVALTAPFAAAAYVVFGVTPQGAQTLAQNASSPLTISLCIALGAGLSVVLISIGTSVRLALKRKPPPEVEERRPLGGHLPQEDNEVYIAQPQFK